MRDSKLLLRITFLVLALTITVLCLRCNSGHRSSPATLPAGWPLPHLALPPGATLEYLDAPLYSASDKIPIIAGKRITINDRFPTVIWDVAFDSRLSWDEMMDFWDDSLRGHDYLIYRDEPELETMRGLTMGARGYISGDSRTWIQCHYTKREGNMVMPAYEGYTYHVIIYDKPHPAYYQDRLKEIE